MNLLRILESLGMALATGALSGLMAAIVPRQLIRARDTAMIQPATAAIVGVLGLILAVGATFVYGLSLFSIVTIVLVPLVVLAWTAIGLIAFAGWIVVAEPFGRILLARLDIQTVPMVAATVGGVALTFGTEFLSAIPFVGWIGSLLALLIGCAGFGALLLTRLGTRSYPPRITTTSRFEIV